MTTATGILNIFASLIGLPVMISALEKFNRQRLGRASAIYIITFGMASLAMLCHGAAVLLSVRHDRPLYYFLRVLSLILFFAMCTGTTWYLTEMIRGHGGEPRTWPRWAVLGISLYGAVLWTASCFHPFLYDIETNEFVSWTAYWVGAAPGLLNTLIDIWLVFGSRRAIGRQNTLLAVFLIVLPILSIGVRYLAPGLDIRFPLIAISLLGIYVMIHIEMDHQIQTQEDIILREKLDIAIERIKPHYIYNVLTSIYYLCDSDPKTAQRAVGNFSDYLRGTLDTLERQELVSFEWEMDLIRNYLTLEKMRYEDRFHMEYQVETTDFTLPPFTVQLLVENAVKHGVGRRDGDGVIRIGSRESGEGFTITVTDNGRGFDGSGEESERLHTGIKTARERLALLSGGTLEVESEVGVGTTATVFIPRK